MVKIKYWLAIQKCGYECLFTEHAPEKRHLMKDGGWFRIFDSNKGEYIGQELPLPKGTIKKLIGRELTYKDEPVEIVFDF